MAASTGQASVSYAGVHPLQSLWGRRDEEAEMNQVLIDVAIVTGASSGLGVGMGGSVVGGLVTASDMNVVDQSSSLPGECGRFCSRDFVGRLPAVSAAPEPQIAAFVRLSRAVGGVSALSTGLAGSYFTTLEADGVEPVGRRLDTATSEGRADVR
jgi:hypothetical protein